MARIRTIKPAAFKSDELFDLEQSTRLPIRWAFAGLWTVADRRGRFAWRPRVLKTDILPHDKCDFSRVLDALATRGLVVKYACDGEEYGWIPGFQRHQVINNREEESKLPPHPRDSDQSTTWTRAPRVDDACPTPLVQVQGEGKGREGKGREGKGREQEGKGRTADADPIAALWNAHTTKPIPKCIEVTPTRAKHIRARRDERTDDEWASVIKRIEASAFCRGQNDRGWVASFDWLIESPNVAVKVLEGKYDNRPKVVSIVNQEPDLDCDQMVANLKKRGVL